MKRRLVRVTLKGPDAEPGRIAAADVARAILGLERAIQRAAASVAPTKRRGSTGRQTAAVERAAHLRFVSARRGSLSAVLALPEDAAEDEATLEFSVADLSEIALTKVLDAIAMKVDADPDRQIASALAQMGDELGVGERTDTIVLERVERPRGPATRRAQINDDVQFYMREVSSRPVTLSQPDVVTGALVEADFESNTARLRQTLGGAVDVSFPSDLADQIQAALRAPAELEGLVAYDPRTATAKSVDVRALYRGEQLELGDSESFWRPRGIVELAREQGVSELAGGGRRPLLVPDLTPWDRADLAALVSEI